MTNPQRPTFHVTARDYLIVKTLTKEQHDELVAKLGRPVTQEPIGTYSRSTTDREDTNP